ncbi:MAG: alpha/beta hydrolase [Rhodobacterales bacterium]|nr:alpha/beta hydrolase [Rhodobacterales bacterium]
MSDPPLYPATAAVPTRPQTVVFLLPGALTTADIFGPAGDWGGHDRLVVEYRLPGMQGEPIAPPLNVERSARWVADYANRFPDAQIQLLGYSTGAVIALEAAGHIEDADRVRVVAVSSATPFPGAALATLRGAIDVMRSALAIGSLNRQAVWEEYYKTLFLGSGWRKSPEKREIAKQMQQTVTGNVLAPRNGMGRAQSGSLLFWTPSEAALSSGADITFFHGDRDPVFRLRDARRLAASFDAPLCVLLEEGHLVFQSTPDLIQRIRQHLDGPRETKGC